MLCGVPLGYDIYPDIGLLFMRGQGKVPQSERMDAMLASFRDPQYGCCSDALIDIADVTSTPRVSELRELIAMLGQQMPADGPRRLAVVTSKPIFFAITRVFAQLIRLHELPFEIMPFMDLGLAWNWLRPGEPPFQLH
jgi:hypothetical protein